MAWITSTTPTNLTYYSTSTNSSTGSIFNYAPTSISVTLNNDIELVNGVRMPPPKEFNKFINASDLLEEFIKFAGNEGVRRGEILNLPIELFIKWLVIQACEQDQEETDVVLALPKSLQPRCLGCQKYMHSKTKIPLHNGYCANHYFKRKQGKLNV